jgi:hypothetical protein
VNLSALAIKTEVTVKLMGNDVEFRKYVDQIKTEINEKLIKGNANNGRQVDEWLQIIYQSYSQRFISDNERIWATGAIMIPLALAIFVALPSIKEPTTLQLITLGIPSILVMMSWLVIAENHRAFQEKSRAWIVAIEETLGLQNTGGRKYQ